jgi:twitching motility protein PilT
LLQAAKLGAADVHYVVGSPPVMRVNDEFTPLAEATVTTAAFADELVKALLTPDELTHLANAREVRGAYVFPDGLRCRFHIFYQKGVPSLSFHVLSEHVPTLRSLRLPKVAERLAGLRHGLVVVAGPYGSGRSSTAVAIVEAVNQSRAARILTIEAPVEYVLASAKSVVEQREVGRDVPTYLEALRQAADEDTQVVFVDAVPDAAAATAAVELASSRLVIVVVEAASAVKALDHLTALPATAEGRAAMRQSLADVLEGVLAQRVLPRVSGGRTAVLEVLLGTGPVRAVVRDGKLAQLPTILQTSRAEGMMSLDQALAEAVRAGEVAEAEAVRHALDPDSLTAALRKGET